jgi:hypothetical protein
LARTNTGRTVRSSSALAAGLVLGLNRGGQPDRGRAPAQERASHEQRRGVVSSRRRLFVIDGALALRKAVDLIFGVGTPVQRCRNHKLRNVLGHLPQAQHDQARSTLKAAFKLDAKEGTAQLKKYATWLERDWPGAAGSLREGLDEMFTINRLGLPSELRQCLATTNLIDNGPSALRDRVRRVKHWQSGLRSGGQAATRARPGLAERRRFVGDRLEPSLTLRKTGRRNRLTFQLQEGHPPASGSPAR